MNDYKYIRAWGRMLGSLPWYIQWEVEKARKDNAPPTATYHNQDGTWSTLEDIQGEETKERIRVILKEMERYAKTECP